MRPSGRGSPKLFSLSEHALFYENQGMRQYANILLVLSVATILAGCNKSVPPKANTAPLAVHTITASPTDESAWVDVLGRVESAHGVQVRSQITGRLKAINFEPGKAVGQNDILYYIEDGTYRAKVLDAEATLATARTNRTKAERDAHRSDELFKQNATSRQANDDAKTALKNARLNEAAAQARWQQAVIDLSHTSVRAPSAGIPALSSVNPGDMITAQSTLMTTLETPSDLRVVFTVADRLLEAKHITLENAIELSTEQGTPLKGTLDYIAPSLNSTAASRTFRAKIAASDLNKVVPGAFIRVRLETGKLQSVYRVPQKAVLQLDSGEYRVYVLKDGRAVSQPVKLAQWVDNDWVVTSGLSSGDKIIVDQLLRLRDGASVTPAAKN